MSAIKEEMNNNEKSLSISGLLQDITAKDVTRLICSTTANLGLI
jgi:hypothetical protein